MKAEIISSGTELLLGEITDTNTPFIAGQLAVLGIDLYYVAHVGDNRERFSGVLRQAWDRSDLVIITGGLGPTQGDITREVIAGMLGEELSVDPDLKDYLSGFFARLGVEMSGNNIKQATLVPSAVALRNASGTAPGWWVEKEGRTIVALPGPPGEMQSMWHSQVLPRLQARSGAVILSRIVKTGGLSEARVDELMSPLLSSPNPTLAIYARADGISLRITAKAPTRDAAASMISERERSIRDILKDYVWGTDDDTLEGVLGELLIARRLSLAVAESITAGFLSYSISGHPESHRYFKGAVVTPACATASTATASSMASAVRSRFGSDVGAAVDGYWETSGGTVTGRTFIALDSGTSLRTASRSFSGMPQQIIRRAVNHALLTIRNFIAVGEDK